MFPRRLLIACLLAFSCATAVGQSPVPAPVVPDQPFVVKLAAPADGTGGFAVVVTKPASGVARWKEDFPPGAMWLDLTDNSGRPVRVFLNPKPGRYAFALSVQLPLGVTPENPTGQDPFAEDALVVVVRDPPPVVTTPTTPVTPTIPTTPITPAPPGPVDPTTKVTAITYVYEKDQGGVPPAVMSGFNSVNRNSNYTIVATAFEQNSTDGTGEVPEQYKAPYVKAKEVGLPSLIVTAGSTVLRFVKAPTTEAAVVEAAQ